MIYLLHYRNRYLIFTFGVGKSIINKKSCWMTSFGRAKNAESLAKDFYLSFILKDWVIKA